AGRTRVVPFLLRKNPGVLVLGKLYHLDPVQLSASSHPGLSFSGINHKFASRLFQMSIDYLVAKPDSHVLNRATERPKYQLVEDGVYKRIDHEAYRRTRPHAMS
ncbi:hypothetical protein FS749_000608, partial [Ceratobasidium sp. UAMH 11750]